MISISIKKIMATFEKSIFCFNMKNQVSYLFFFLVLACSLCRPGVWDQIRFPEAVSFLPSKYLSFCYSEHFLFKFQSNFMLKYLLIRYIFEFIVYAEIFLFNR